MTLPSAFPLVNAANREQRLIIGRRRAFRKVRDGRLNDANGLLRATRTAIQQHLIKSLSAEELARFVTFRRRRSLRYSIRVKQEQITRLERHLRFIVNFSLLN